MGVFYVNLVHFPNATKFCKKIFTYHLEHPLLFLYLCIDFKKIKTMLREDTIKKFDELNLVDLYNSGETFTSLRKKYHVWYGTAKEYLIQHGVKN